MVQGGGWMRMPALGSGGRVRAQMRDANSLRVLDVGQRAWGVGVGETRAIGRDVVERC
jgi:hypothetical protein